MAAATMVCWPLGTCARALRIQCTRQRCQVAPSTRLMAWRNPSSASEITSLTPLRPRLTSPLRKPRPERLGLRGADAKTDDLAPAFGGDRHGDYCRDRHN